MYDNLIGAIQSIGTSEFYRPLIDVAKREVEADVEWVVRYSPHVPPALIHCGKRPQTPVSVDFDMVNKLYDEGFYRLDPWLRYWTSYKTAGLVTPDTLPGHFAKDDFYSALKPFLGDMDVMVMFLPAFGGNCVALFLERETPFDMDERTKFLSLFPAMLALHKVHIQNLMTQTWLGAPAERSAALQLPSAVQIRDGGGRVVYESESWLAARKQNPGFARAAESVRGKGDGKSIKTDVGMFHVDRMDFPELWGRDLSVVTHEVNGKVRSSLDIDKAIDDFEPTDFTPREREMVRLMLLGNSNERMAEKLSIGIGTIRNHRKRIYDKLYISAERDLFSMFLSSLNENA